MEKARRFRSVQEKFRLTPEESAILKKDVEASGMSRNEYIIKTLINRSGLSALSCERKICGNSVEISFKLADKPIGYASCLYFENLNKVQISSFFVVKPFWDFGIEEKLFEEILYFAKLRNATEIIAYAGAEPHCPTGWKSIETQVKWYENLGFRVDHIVSGSTPCMIKALQRETS